MKYLGDLPRKKSIYSIQKRIFYKGMWKKKTYLKAILSMHEYARGWLAEPLVALNQYTNRLFLEQIKKLMLYESLIPVYIACSDQKDHYLGNLTTLPCSLWKVCICDDVYVYFLRDYFRSVYLHCERRRQMRACGGTHHDRPPSLKNEVQMDNFILYEGASYPVLSECVLSISKNSRWIR